MSRGRGRLSRSSWAGVVSSSSMISLQRSMHSSQMYTPGPGISFFTCRWLLPQKLHSSCSLVSVGRAIRWLIPRAAWLLGEGRGVPDGGRGLRWPWSQPSLMLRDHSIDDAVFGSLFGAHEVIALGVARNLLERLPGVVGDDLVEALADVEDLAS